MAQAHDLALILGRIAPHLHWRMYDDGVIVMVPATSEMHVLQPDLMPAFQPGALLISDAMQTERVGRGPAGWAPEAVVLQESLFMHLWQLRIIERIDQPLRTTPCPQ